MSRVLRAKPQRLRSKASASQPGQGLNYSGVELTYVSTLRASPQALRARPEHSLLYSRTLEHDSQFQRR